MQDSTILLMRNALVNLLIRGYETVFVIMWKWKSFKNWCCIFNF